MMRKEEKICYATVVRQYDCVPQTAKRYLKKNFSRKSKTIKKKIGPFAVFSG